LFELSYISTVLWRQNNCTTVQGIMETHIYLGPYNILQATLKYVSIFLWQSCGVTQKCSRWRTIGNNLLRLYENVYKVELNIIYEINILDDRSLRLTSATRRTGVADRWRWRRVVRRYTSHKKRRRRSAVGSYAACVSRDPPGTPPPRCNRFCSTAVGSSLAHNGRGTRQ